MANNDSTGSDGSAGKIGIAEFYREIGKIHASLESRPNFTFVLGSFAISLLLAVLTLGGLFFLVIDSKVGPLETSLGTHKQSIEDLRKDVRGTADDLSEIKGQLASLNSTAIRIDGRATKIDELVRTNAQLAVDYRSIQDSLVSVKGEISGLPDKFNSVAVAPWPSYAPSRTDLFSGQDLLKGNGKTVRPRV